MKKRLLFWLVALLTATTSLTSFASEDELLDPEKAFALQVTSIDANTVRAEWTIADGYYMYKDKFVFNSGTSGVTLGTPVFPKGKIKNDEFFGKIEVYYHKVSVDIPLKGAIGDSVSLNIKSQGCNEPLGVCYPPMNASKSVKLAASASGAIGSLTKFAGDLGLSGGNDELLEPDKAFIFDMEVTDGNTLTARWQIAEGYYLYKNKIHFTLKNADGIKLGKIDMPKGKEKNDEFFGRMEVYYHGLDIPISLLRSNTAATTITLETSYQGCSEAQGVCYPPINKSMTLDLSAGMASTGTAAGSSVAVSEQDDLANKLASGNTLLTVLTFFGLGLLLAFTPCVFPMIPILSSIIAGQGETMTTRKAFTMSSVYVLAMALTYTIAGVIMGLIGENVQAVFQNAWVLGTFAAIFVALSFSMFGFYELQMPNFIQSRLTEFSNKQEGGTLAGVAIMGFLSALIVGPCVTAPLIGALIYIGQTGDAVLGGMALFALSMGMGVPLIAIGTSAGKILPRAGAWMDTIKAVFGVLLIGVAIWMLERVLPGTISMLLWALLLIISAVYMGAIEPIREAASGWTRLWKGMGLVMLIYGSLILIGVAAGGHDVMQPLKGIAPAAGSATGTTQANHLNFKQIKTVDDLKREVAKASAEGKSVMLDFYADWCVSCKEFEKYTFGDAKVQQALSNSVLLQADVTANNDADKALLKHFKLIGPPSIIFYGADGQERRAYRVVGFMDAEKFAAHVKQALQ